MSGAMHLAQVNIGRLAYGQDAQEVAEFIENLDRVNAMAERMPGYVWRVKDESGNATALPFDRDPTMIANVTVWESVEALQAFVFQTAHARFYRKRESWFEKLDRPHFAMWWIEEGHRPTYEEAAQKLRQLERDGPSAIDAPGGVFGWAETAAAVEWRRQRCA
jgi:heme-degrading monooxygenase HmoA